MFEWNQGRTIENNDTSQPSSKNNVNETNADKNDYDEQPAHEPEEIVEEEISQEQHDNQFPIMSDGDDDNIAYSLHPREDLLDNEHNYTSDN